MARVLALTSMYPPHHYGGYELQCQAVLERFRSEGHEVAVLTSDIRVAGVPEADDPSVRRELQWYWRDHELLRPPLRQRLRIERSNHDVLRDTLGRFRPDVVSVWQMGGMSLSLLAELVERRLPLVFVICDGWLDYGRTVDPWISGWRRAGPLAAVGRRWARVPTVLPPLGNAGTFCFVSEATRHHAEAATGWHFEHAAVVPSAVDSDVFRIACGERVWDWRLVVAARIDPRKGIDVAIRAMRHLPSETTLEIVGRGDDRHLAALRALTAEEGVTARVTFREETRQGLAARYAAADVCLFTPRWEEPFGLVPLEAMACGTPVVATATGGSAEFLRHGENCLLVRRGDDAAVAAAVRRLAADPGLRQHLVEGGTATAARFGIDAVAAEFERHHLTAIARRP